MKIRKNDRSYLQDLKIDIRCDRDDHYQELALLFDKPQFLNLLPLIRKEYGFVNLVSFEECQDGTFDIFEELFDRYYKKINLSKYKNIERLKNSLPDFYEEIQEENDCPMVFENECYLLCFEFNRPPYFYNVIGQTIYCRVVSSDNFKPTKAEIIEPDAMWFGVTLPPIAIFVSPTSTYEDVKEEFKKAKELMEN